MSNVYTKYFPVDATTGYLQMMITTDAETQESLGDMNESLGTLLALQYLYVVGVLNFGGEETVNDILRETIHSDECAGPVSVDSGSSSVDDGV